jgi:hypothetical protein
MVLKGSFGRQLKINLTISPRSSHTHLQTATSQRNDQSLQKSVPTHPKKKFIFFFPPFGVLIFLPSHNL